MFWNIVVAISGLYLIWLGLMFEVKGLGSGFVFKFLPMILGVLCIFYSLKMLGVL